MAGESFGRGSAFGHGIESTWGTAVSRSNWLQVFSCTLQERPEFAWIDHLSSGQADYSEDYQVRTGCSGDLELPFLYEGCGVVLAHAMGSTPGAASGGGPYVHTFNRGTSFPGLTVELVRGTSGKSEILTGVVFPSWELVFERGAVSRFRASLLGKFANAARSSAATPSYGGTVQSRAMLGHHVGSITWDGNQHTAQRISISVDNKLERMEDLGSLYTGQPGMGGFGEVLVRATISHRSETLYNAWRAGTEGDITFSVTSGALDLAVTARNARIRSAPADIRGAGLITEEIEFACKADASGSGSSDGALTFVLTNNQANYYTN